MRKETLGAALFFCGLGIMITVVCPLEGLLCRFALGGVLLLVGMKIGKCFK